MITQKNADGNWLPEQTSFENGLVWSTNENERIVECKVMVYYFAQIEVDVKGGVASFTITQIGVDDSYGKDLLAEGYVDTTSYFTITANPSEGYNFICWTNNTTAQTRYSQSLLMITQRKVNMTMYVEGEVVTLNFSEYSARFGQILGMSVTSMDGTVTDFPPLGEFQNGTFVKFLTTAKVKVGDKVTFVMHVDYGFAVIWNRDDIVFEDYRDEQYYFSMMVSPSDASATIAIVPTFREEILSIYISQKFADDEFIENATDDNMVSFAGYTTYNDRKTTFLTSAHNQNIRIGIVVNPRYAVSKITIRNYDKEYTSMEEFVTEEGMVLLTEDYMQANIIVGVVNIEIEYVRLYWNDVDVEGRALSGDGTEKDPYRIRSIEDLILMMKLCNSNAMNVEGVAYRDCHYELMEDMDLSERFWTPIGTEQFPFCGSFNFRGHSVKGINLAIFYKTHSYNGLFGVLGANANIFTSPASLWWVYLIVGIVVLLILILVLMLLLNRKRKKRNEELAKR